MTGCAEEGTIGKIQKTVLRFCIDQSAKECIRGNVRAEQISVQVQNTDKVIFPVDFVEIPYRGRILCFGDFTDIVPEERCRVGGLVIEDQGICGFLIAEKAVYGIVWRCVFKAFLIRFNVIYQLVVCGSAARRERRSASFNAKT